MPFSAERTTGIKALIRSRLEQQRISEWERSFLSNMDAKFAKDGTRTNLSKTQHAKLHSILRLTPEQVKARTGANRQPELARGSSRPERKQNPIKTTKRALNAPRRAMRRAQHQLVLPLVIIGAVFALIGVWQSPDRNSTTYPRSC